MPIQLVFHPKDSNLRSRTELAITDPEFAEIAQLIQRTTGCGGLTSDILTKKICLLLGVTECEGRNIYITEEDNRFLG